MSNIGKCKLCKRNKPLQMSHVIPRFVRKQTRATSAVENPRYYTVEGGEFQKLEQDFAKRAWLCKDCEQLLSRSEKRFAEDVYQGIWADRVGSATIHEEHVRRFLVSMAWRAWQWYDEHPQKPFRRVSNHDRLKEAEQTWREYLLHKRADVGAFEQHMLLQRRQTASASGRIVKLDGFYWDRGINLDMLSNGRSKEEVSMVYAKIPKIAIFGVVEQAKIGYWQGTLVEPGLGDKWTSQNAVVPDPILHYMGSQSEKMLASMGTVPEAGKKTTRNKMDILVKKEGEGYLKRNAVQSLVAEDLVELPGNSIVSDAISWAANSSEPGARIMGELLGRLTEAELTSLHRETNKIGMRCKALRLEERFSLLADGREESREPGTSILVGVEVYRTPERAEQKSRLPLKFRVDSEEVTLAIGAQVVPAPLGHSRRGIRYLE